MPTYMVLANFTEQGRQHIKDLPTWLREGEERLRQAGGRFVAWYALQGPYDALAVVEVPNDEAGLPLLLTLNREGNVRTTSFKAYSRDEFEKALGALR